MIHSVGSDGITIPLVSAHQLCGNPTGTVKQVRFVQVKQETQNVVISELEAKQGVSDVAETLAFMHASRLAHCNLAPESIFITSDGAWKLAGFGFVRQITQELDGSGA